MGRARRASVTGVGIALAAAAASVLLRGTGAAPPSSPAVERAQASPSASAVTQPLVLVEHPTRRRLNVDLARARDLLAGRVTSWKQLGAEPAPVRAIVGADVASLLSPPPSGLRIVADDDDVVSAVAADRNTIGAIPAEGLGPRVRAISVSGVNPLRDPDRYPLRMPGTRPAGAVVTALSFGDILTARTVDKIMVARNDFTSPFTSVGRALAGADLAFGNFEGAMSAHETPLHGKVTRFVSRPRALEGLKAAGIDYLSLANNHSGDYGSRVLLETAAHLRSAGIATSGAGRNDAEAHLPAVVVRKGIRFAFVSFNAIIGGTPAGSTTPGVATIHMKPWYPFSASDLARVAAEVRAARAAADVVIVFPHWGQEYTASPNDDQRRVARALVDAGADVLIGSHPHWVQGAEVWHGRLIAYSLGNFVCDQTWSTETQQGSALSLTFWGAKLVDASFLPVRIEDWHRPRMLAEADTEGAAILRRIWNASGDPYGRAGS